MELTRRDAVAALAASGIVIGATGAVADRLSQDERGRSGAASLTPGELATVNTAADIVYPEGVTATDDFLEAFVLGRDLRERQYLTGLKEAIAVLDNRAKARFGIPFQDVTPTEGDRLLREIGVAKVDPVPDGTHPERIRYYVVNNLLYGLYTSPKGGRLLGNENPMGYPGGQAAYQQPPMDDG